MSRRRSSGRARVRILVANLMTEPGETDSFGVLEHLLTIDRHLGRQLFDCVIYNTTPVPEALAAVYRERAFGADRDGDVRSRSAGSLRRPRDRRAAGVGAPGGKDPASPGAARGGDHSAGARQARRLAARAPRSEVSDNVRTFLSAPRTPIRAQSGSRNISTRAASTRKRSITCATGSKAMPASS